MKNWFPFHAFQELHKFLDNITQQPWGGVPLAAENGENSWRTENIYFFTISRYWKISSHVIISNITKSIYYRRVTWYWKISLLVLYSGSITSYNLMRYVAFIDTLILNLWFLKYNILNFAALKLRPKSLTLFGKFFISSLKGSFNQFLDVFIE